MMYGGMYLYLYFYVSISPLFKHNVKLLGSYSYLMKIRHQIILLNPSIVLIDNTDHCVEKYLNTHIYTHIEMHY